MFHSSSFSSDWSEAWWHIIFYQRADRTAKAFFFSNIEVKVELEILYVQVML